MKKYNHLFFDLDRTLWDFDTNAGIALKELYKIYKLQHYFSSEDEFFELYQKHNERLWAQYREGNLRKETLRSKRFELALREKKINDPDLAEKIGDDYLEISMNQTGVFPGTHETLNYLKKALSFEHYHQWL